MSRSAALISRRSVLQAISLVTAASTVTFSAGMAMADPNPPAAPPSEIKGAQVVTTADVKSMIDRGERVIIIDARRMGKWENGRIVNALKVNWKPNFVIQGWSFDNKPLGSDKSARIVIYGENESDGWAGQVVQKAVAEGFTNVMWLRGGFAEWVAARMPTTS